MTEWEPQLSPYDPEWPNLFEAERSRLTRVFGSEAVIEHVGSTAVPGLGAKPIIDILVGLPALEKAELQIQELAALGYEYVPQYEAAIPDRRYFRRPRSRPRTHHLHCVVRGGHFWHDHIMFRDYLRTHPRQATRYLHLKRDLARRHARDRQEYVEGKTTFIRDALARAAAESLGFYSQR